MKSNGEIKFPNNGKAADVANGRPGIANSIKCEKLPAHVYVYIKINSWKMIGDKLPWWGI